MSEIKLPAERRTAFGKGAARRIRRDNKIPAVLYAHVGGSGVPDYVGIITDELVLNPWDREIYVNGEFRYHPEYVEALVNQGGDVDQVLLIPSPKYVVEKGIESTRASI